jgi:hypothetical protein
MTALTLLAGGSGRLVLDILANAKDVRLVCRTLHPATALGFSGNASLCRR